MALVPARPHRPSPRVRAPRLAGRWVGPAPDLAGRFVLLDFWTGSCVNCVHVLAELRPLAARFAGDLVVVGVHSPKFDHEAEPGAVQAAVARLEVDHPVLDDADRSLWSAYAVRAWPTLVLVDPDGYVVATRSGEGHGAELERLVADLLAHRPPRTAPRPVPADDAPVLPDDTPLRFPARAIALPGGSLLVADAGHHQLVELAADLTTVLRRIGSGRRELADGPAAEAGFAAPQGLALLPPRVAQLLGADVAVADTGNHAVRGVRLADGHVRTLAGTGRQLRRRSGGGPARAQDLASPTDVAWWPDAGGDGDGGGSGGDLLVAVSGTHQLWAFDPDAGTVRVVAGTTAEGLLDGPAERAWLAQPSGLAVGTAPEGGAEALAWFVDAETSALRTLRRTAPPDRRVPVVTDERMANVDPVALPGAEVTTHVGRGLFEFGHRDGPADRALLQHPLGLALDARGTAPAAVLVADTFDGALRRYDPLTRSVETLLTGLAEPADVLVEEDDDGGGGAVVVVESAAHRLTRWSLRRRDRRLLAEVRLAADAELVVDFTPGAGRRVDERWGPPVRVEVSADPPGALGAGAGSGTGWRRPVRVVAAGRLRVDVRVATCDESSCRLEEFTVVVPVRPAGQGEPLLRIALP
ncbi:thioredoxin-like domain-containing protein [Kineococcus sp. SYSU DK006]|uniref:thioredoxin-like domain-containing protein n=1 Tax=Kineococcus sp. SYSU DK006 TaxID=3383127 RepID=UPI003D7E1164